MSRILVTIAAALAAGSALAQSATTPAAPQKAAAAPSASNVATVDGKPITKASVDQFMQLIGQPDSPELRERIKEELIEREVFYEEATKRGIADRPDVKFQADLARKSAIIQNLFRDEAKKHPVTDQQIQAEYDKQKAQQGEKEYHARHILVEKEDEAKDIIEQLKKGAKFEDLAKKSKDPGSGGRGGDLGWAAPTAYVKPFSDAMVKLEKGKFTETPVQTQFGYHVIELEDVRATQFPPIDQLKTQIAENLQKSQAQSFAEDLKKKAKIQ
ncbi:MAG TPA: peptidylprolyl isomerase [Burkholderiaceae bacterium]